MFTRKKALSATLEQSLDLAEAQGRSLWRDAWIRFFRNKAAVVSLILLILIVITSLVGPYLTPNDFESTDWGSINVAPTWVGVHWFGTDALGRDLLVRTMVGTRVSLLVGMLGTISSVAIGIIWGAVSGFAGGKVDGFLMRIVDIMYAVPYLLIAILLVTFFGRDFFWVILTITAFSWMDMARIVRGQTMAIKSKEYVESAHAIGVSKLAIIYRHIVPNLLGIVIVYTTITIPGVILTESALSFLGLGVQEPMTSLGVLIQNGASVMYDTPWVLLYPAVVLSVIIYCVNYIGDGMRDALDPKEY